MKTYQELEQENKWHKANIEKLIELIKYMDNGYKIEKPKGEFHHHAFEKLCPEPDLSEITILK